ncbi:MAG: DUF1850 domain-containing protein [Tissierellia bacterium]|nr:DUF1850 domain-containing protein [Bacillota bacterium]NLL23225.1 DUF1850 domain-containing protein [Tissierellia bacterium]
MKWAFSEKKPAGKGKKTFPAFLLLLLILCFPVHVLSANSFHDSRTLHSWLMLGKREFTVTFTHSVELTEVREIYRLESNDIYLVETVFSSYGAGLPSTTSYPFEMTEDGFRIYDMHQKMDPLVYRTGAARANHRLVLGNRDIPFLEFSQPAEGVCFETKRIPLFIYLMKEIFNE